MSPTSNFVSTLREWLRDAKKVLILPHKNIDPDAAGAAIALAHALRRQNIDVKIASESLPLDGMMASLPLIETIGGEENIEDFEDFDVVFLVDHSEKSRTGLDLPDEGWPKTVIIDHHPVKTSVPTKNVLEWRDPDLPATCAMIGSLLSFLKFEISPATATVLLNGIYTDTGGFKFGNGMPKAMSVAQDLIKNGADIGFVKQFLTEKTEVKLRLWGRMMREMRKTKDGGVVVVVKQEDLDAVGADEGDVASLSNFLSGGLGESVKFTMVVREKDGELRMSMRSGEKNFSVGKIAKIFGGGGHEKAAGAGVSGKISEEMVWRVR